MEQAWGLGAIDTYCKLEHTASNINKELVSFCVYLLTIYKLENLEKNRRYLLMHEALSCILVVFQCSLVFFTSERKIEMPSAES